MLTELIERYRWADPYDNSLVEALTIAVVEGRTTEEIIRIYGGDPAQPVGNFTFAEAYQLQRTPREHTGYRFDSGINFHLQTKVHNDAVTALEHNGYTGAVPEIARRCSAHGGRFFSIYWNVNASYAVTAAEDAAVTAFFDPLLDGPEAWPGRLHPDWLDLNDFATERMKSACLALLEQQTGVAFDRAWLDEKLPTYRIPDPDVLLRDVPDAREP